MKRFFAWLCAVSFCLALLPAPARAVDDVHFFAVNDRLVPLMADTMPAWVNGVLYVPASAFENSVTGVTLSLYCSQSRDGSMVTLYNLRQMLVFELETGIAYDQHTGTQLSEHAISRNNRAYLPLAAVCEFFHLEYSYNYTEYGALVRLKNNSEALSDAGFIDAGSSLMKKYLKEYMKNNPGQTPGNPGTSDPLPPPVTEPEGERWICLAFTSQSARRTAEILKKMDRAECQVLVLFSEEELIRQDDLVRRVVGSGHWIGLRADGATVEESRAQLARCNEILLHAARTAATIALVPESQRMELSKNGWVCWESTLDARQESEESAKDYAQRLVQEIGNVQETVCLLMDDGEGALNVVTQLLMQLEQEQYTIIAPLETRL